MTSSHDVDQDAAHIYRDLAVELEPATALEAHLARRMAFAIARARHAEQMESECMAIVAENEQGPNAMGHAAIRDAHGAKSLDLIRRFARSADDQFFQALDSLTRLREQSRPRASRLSSGPPTIEQRREPMSPVDCMPAPPTLGAPKRRD